MGWSDCNNSHKREISENWSPSRVEHDGGWHSIDEETIYKTMCYQYSHNLRKFLVHEPLIKITGEDPICNKSGWRCGKEYSSKGACNEDRYCIRKEEPRSASCSSLSESSCKVKSGCSRVKK